LKALATRDGPIQHHGISRLNVTDFGTSQAHDAGTFMAHDKRSFPTERSVISVANPGGLDLNKNFVVDGLSNLDTLKRESSSAIGDGCLGLHGPKL
jgi:hypothetical protein